MEPDEITKQYRKDMAAEMARPEVDASRKELLAFFEAPAASPFLGILSPGFWSPAAVLMAVLFVFHQMQAQVSPIMGPSEPIYQSMATLHNEAAPVPVEIPEPVIEPPRVVVKRVSSQMGPTLVYQRTYHETPVTIVWIFPGTGLKPGGNLP